jgi:VanZ family protein
MVIPPRLRVLARWLSVAAVVTLTVLSVLPGYDRPHTGASGNLEHFVAYAITANLLAVGFPALRAWRIIACLSVAAAAFEVLQIWIPGRTAGPDNWIASTAGALIGASMVVVFVRHGGATREAGGP